MRNNSKKKNTILLLLKNIRNLNLNDINGIKQAQKINADIIKELLTHRSKLKTKYKLNEYFYAEYSAEEDILFGLLDILNKKVLDYAKRDYIER